LPHTWLRLRQWNPRGGSTGHGRAKLRRRRTPRARALLISGRRAGWSRRPSSSLPPATLQNFSALFHAVASVYYLTYCTPAFFPVEGRVRCTLNEAGSNVIIQKKADSVWILMWPLVGPCKAIFQAINLQ